MKVSNMQSSHGNPVPNQFIIRHGCGLEVFQSYDSVIVKIEYLGQFFEKKVVSLDSDTWDYSVTTGKYRNQFLGETKRETQAKINSGEYILTNLNR